MVIAVSFIYLHYDVRQRRTDWRAHCTPKTLLVMVAILFEIVVSWHKIQKLQNVGNSHVRTFCLFLILLKPLFGDDKYLLHRNGGGSRCTSNATESASPTNVLSARYDWKQFRMSSASPTDLKCPCDKKKSLPFFLEILKVCLLNT